MDETLPSPPPHSGFRVRCGLHSGLEPGRDVFYTKVTGRRGYAGPAMALAKTVSDLVPGGMVVMTAAAFARLQPWPSPDALPGAIVWSRGRYRVNVGEGVGAASVEVDLFQLLCPQVGGGGVGLQMPAETKPNPMQKRGGGSGGVDCGCVHGCGWPRASPP